MVKRFACIFLASTQLCFADPIRLLANQPFTPSSAGWFFVDADEQKIRARLVEADYIEKQLALEIELSASLRKLADKQAELATTYQTAFEKENDQVIKLANQQSWNRWLYLALGVGLTLAAGAAIGATAKGLK